MKRKTMKRIVFSLASAVMGLAVLTSCGSSAGSGAGPAAEQTEYTDTLEQATGEADYGLPPATAARVELPEDVETMQYPVWALLLSAVVDRMPYYGYVDNATDENADAFFCPMSLLTSLIEEKTDLGQGQETEDGYYMVSEERFSCYANALFDSYGMQEIEAPELSDDTPYGLINDSDDYPYSFPKADLTHYESVVTGYTLDEEHYEYELVAELRDVRTNLVLFEATFRMKPSSFEGSSQEDLFHYSITGISDETDYTENASVDLPPAGSEPLISKEEADAAAQKFAPDSDVIYQGKENLDGLEYYHYSYKDDQGKSREILVPQDGTEPVGGIKNDDGTWSFDQ